MAKLLDRQNAILLFKNGKYLKVYATGKTGIFTGFLTIIEGNFSVSELQEFDNEYHFFLTNQSYILIDKLKTNKHIVVMANDFLKEKNANIDIGNVTLVGCCLQDITNDIMALYITYIENLVRSAIAPLTMVAAVAQKTVSKIRKPSTGRSPL